MNMTDEESLPSLRFSQFPGVPPFLNYIVGPGDVPVHPPPILRSLIEQLSPFLWSVKQVVLPTLSLCCLMFFKYINAWQLTIDN